MPANRLTGNDPDLNSRLVLWCQSLLGVSDFGLDDDFFGSGGDSLHVVRLLAKIKRVYRVDLELASLSDARTMRLLAREVLRASEAGGVQQKIWTSLVQIQPGGTQTPLFCVHAIGGDIDLYVQMADKLGKDQPVYAFRSPLLFQRNIREISISELAATYVKEIRLFFPEGPYFLAGASFGGHLVFEMAQQLFSQGIEPALVLIIDAVVPGSDESLEVKDRVSTVKKRLRSEGLSYVFTKIASKFDYICQVLAYRTRVVLCRLHYFARRPLSFGLRFFEIEIVHRRALMQHEFRKYPGRITLMKAVDPRSEVLSKRRDSTLGWGALAENGVCVHELAATHISMLYPPALDSFVKLLHRVLYSSRPTTSMAVAD